MEENIFDLLEEWDMAIAFEDREREHEIGRKIEALRARYRRGEGMEEKAKLVGVFREFWCDIKYGDRAIGALWNLKYTGRGGLFDNTRIYENENAMIWLDYAEYE